MGPPRFSGGKAGSLCQSDGYVDRFNGAAAFQRRKAVLIDFDALRQASLQWGRRVSAAERSGGRVSRLVLHVASMGPPRFSGGKDQAARLAHVRAHSFNGAAAFQRRKAPPRPWWSRRRRSFNGAAAFQRRKVPEPRVPVVQAVRCFNGAAAFQRRKAAGAAAWSLGAALLQWGRRVSAAERSRTSARSAWARSGFNGAAAFQRRKDVS